MPLIYIPDINTSVASMFRSKGFDVTHTYPSSRDKKPDCVVFTGGSDLCPMLYGEFPHPETLFNLERDVKDIGVFRRVMRTSGYGKGGLRNVPLVGICRGAQLLNTLAGGGVFQHVDGHRESHDVIIVGENTTFKVTSTHHQMMRTNHLAKTLAYSKLSTKKETGDPSIFVKFPNEDNRFDPEVVWYDHMNALCFQPHPEYSPEVHKENTDYFFNLIEDNFGLKGASING